MAVKNVTYKEPANYFNDDMKKAAQKWEKEQAEKEGEKPAKESNKNR